MNMRRWPPGEQHGSPERRGQWTGKRLDEDRQAPGVADAIGDLSKVMRALSPAVLGSATYQVGPAGNPPTESYARRFEALTIASTSQQYLVLTSDTAKQSAPGSGPGVAIVPPRGFLVAHMTGHAWTVYGGLPGDQITMTAFTRPLPPAMSTGAVLAVSDYPAGAIPVDGDSGIVGAATATATLPNAIGKTTWITGFEATAAGATAAAVVIITVAGIAVPKHYVFTAPAGVTTAAAPLVVEFTKPIPASAQNIAITVSMPTLGAGNTAAAITAHGYQL